MHIHSSCAGIKERLEAELQEATHPHERGAILIAALYELSRTVLPDLGPPRKSDEYAQRREAVLELITFIAIHLIRGPEHERRGVAVLSELAEGCQDPLLKKKLSVYAQELLAKSDGSGRSDRVSMPRAVFLAGIMMLIATLLYHVWPALFPPPKQRAVVAALPEAGALPSGGHQPVLPAPAAVAAQDAAASDRDKGSDEVKQPPQAQAEAKVAVPLGDHITRIRISNSQVLVPVILRNAGEAVKVELVLDTGATRSAVRDGLVNRLRIDLRGSRSSLVEVADGRVVTSRVAKIDALVVGPFALMPAEVEIIPYRGSDGMHDGLLGMDFLGKRRYQIDMEHEVIRWF